MMDELKEIINMIASLPHMALWVIAGFWAYKVIVIGSIYGVIRFAIDRAHSWATTDRHEYRQIRPLIDKLTISGCADDLAYQIGRLKGVASRSSAYIHPSDVDWLRKAIDEKMQREEKEK